MINSTLNVRNDTYLEIITLEKIIQFDIYCIKPLYMTPNEMFERKKSSTVVKNNT